MELNSLIYPAPEPSVYLDCYLSSQDPIHKSQLILVDAHKLAVDNGGVIPENKKSAFEAAKQGTFGESGNTSTLSSMSSKGAKVSTEDTKVLYQIPCIYLSTNCPEYKKDQE